MQFRGVAPQADIIGIKVLDSTGQGRASSVMAGILWAIAHRERVQHPRPQPLDRQQPGRRPREFDPIAQAVEVAWKNGITVVCAAGNEGEFGPGGILSPGNSPYVITVGATDTRQTAGARRRRRHLLQLGRPDALGRVRQAGHGRPGNRLISLRVKGSYIDTNFPQNLIPVADYAPDAPADADPSYLMLSGTSTRRRSGAGAAALMIGEDPA